MTTADPLHVAAAQAGDERAFRALVEPVPPRARGPLLPDARLRPRRRGRRPGDAAARLALARALRGPLLGGDLALPDRHQRLPRRARAPAAARRAVVEPYPTSACDDADTRSPTPPRATPLREGMELAFLTAIQRLPGRQRAVLILRDVLGWTGAEAAELLDTTVTARQQRAAAGAGDDRGRGARARRRPGRRSSASCCAATSTPGSGRTCAALVELLREDAVMTMPPEAAVVGADAIVAFFEPTASRACTSRRRRPGSTAPRPSSCATPPASSHRLLVLDVLDDRITHIGAYRLPKRGQSPLT